MENAVAKEQSVGRPGTREPPKELQRARRKRNTLSREMIVAGALEILGETPVEKFTLAPLAERLSATTMSLYTYFGSREALLSAVAEHVFALFQPPPPTSRWQDYVYNWLWVLKRHFDRYPAAIELMAFEDTPVSSAWFKTFMPIIELVNAQGLSGEQLAFVIDWFGNAAMGFIHSQMGAPARRARGNIAYVGALPPASQRLAAELCLDFAAVDGEASIDFGFRWITAGLETLVADAVAPKPRNSRAKP